MSVEDLSFTAIHKDGTLLDEFLEDLSAKQPDWRVGAALRLPRFRLAYCADKLDEWRPSADYLLADPETRQMLLPFDKRGAGRADYPYLAESDPAANRQRFVTQALQAQKRAGAKVLISPWLIHGTSGTHHELQVTTDLARRALEHKFAADSRILIGIEAMESIFSNATSRDRMIDEIVDLDGSPAVYLRMTTPAASSGRRQYENEAALKGLRQAVESLRDNGHDVVLGQTGLAGWLMLPFGAVAFGSGVSGTLQRSQVPVNRDGGGGGQPPLQWHFCEPLLSFVRADEVAGLSGVQGYAPCDCPYCDGADPQPGAAFDRKTSDKHFLYCCARLAEEVRQSADRPATVRQRLAAAQQFATGVPQSGVTLDHRSRPGHLEAWTRVVA